MTNQTGVGTFDFSSLGSAKPLRQQPAATNQMPTGNLPNGGSYIGSAPEQPAAKAENTLPGWPSGQETTLPAEPDQLPTVEPEAPETLPEPVVEVVANKVASTRAK